MNKQTNGHDSDSAGAKKIIFNNPLATKNLPSWYLGAKKAFKPFYWIAGFIILWCVITYFNLLDPNLSGSITLLLSVLLFVISIPVGIFLRMDVLADHYARTLSTEAVLIFALPIVLLNFLLIGAYLGWRKKLRMPNVSKDTTEVKN